MPIDQVQLSKFLSFVLRHKPDAIGLALRPGGWVSVDELIEKANAAGTRFDRQDLLHVVATSDKKRFSVSEDGSRIRAAQGHSVSVELGLSPREPPAVLYHGTATRFLESIRSIGLKPQARQQMHLSIDEATARRVGQRHRKPVVLKVDAGAMHAMGSRFYLADNGVWLNDEVPPEFLGEGDERSLSGKQGEQRSEPRRSEILGFASAFAREPTAAHPIPRQIFPPWSDPCRARLC